MEKKASPTVIIMAVVVTLAVIAGIAWMVWASIAPKQADLTADQEIVSHEGHDHADPTKTSAQAAAQAVMGAAYSWQPAHFETPLDGLLGVSDRLTEELAEQMEIAATDPNHVVANEWDTWAKNGDVISAATETTNEEIRDDLSKVTVLVTQNVLTSQGDVTPYSQFEVTVDAVATTGQSKQEMTWLVQRFAITNVIF
ncbi:hypothetical protein [Corynebacterium callunae]|uniref:Uncharacterized protein n=1 Tax=Corynebacterium callunae DSM 20147 TaxID=1121353 RepID=M1UXW8_9CORY|nr:hypothetical protein [Corynebacterium callunae]AGG66193.1 hypothetical protein H924_03725 [Corynebacterium callunae DSM 20147]